MEDGLKKYIENEIGFFLDDKLYYKLIDDLSHELVTKKVCDDLKMYSETHRSDLISSDAYNYVKKRVKYFKDKLIYCHYGVDYYANK